MENVCPCCGRADESTAHITRCPADGRRIVLNESIQEMRKWLKSEQTDAEATELICKYLEGFGDTKMSSLLRSPRSKYKLTAWCHDRLGWDNFLEGRICAVWFDHRDADISKRKLKRSATQWMTGLMRRLLQITHQQWTYRNATVHVKIKDGKTVAQHEEILKEITNCALIDPEDLLAEHKHLFFTDFKKLTSGPTKDKLEWIAEAKMANAAAHQVARRTKAALRTRYSTSKYKYRQETEEVLVDSLGSLRWRVRIRK